MRKISFQRRMCHVFPAHFPMRSRPCAPPVQNTVVDIALSRFWLTFPSRSFLPATTSVSAQTRLRLEASFSPTRASTDPSLFDITAEDARSPRAVQKHGTRSYANLGGLLPTPPTASLRAPSLRNLFAECARRLMSRSGMLERLTHLAPM